MKSYTWSGDGPGSCTVQLDEHRDGVKGPPKDLNLLWNQDSYLEADKCNVIFTQLHVVGRVMKEHL